LAGRITVEHQHDPVKPSTTMTVRAFVAIASSSHARHRLVKIERLVMAADRHYIPAAGRDWRLPLYDPIVKLLGGDKARRVLVEQAQLQPAEQVLEVGCGTGSLLVFVKQLHPDVDVTGLDPDPKALARAQRKADAASMTIRLDRGFSDALPYEDTSFDVVFSSFMFHHLERVDEKLDTLREVRRVLRPAGRLHLVDFTPSESARRGILGHLGHSHLLRDNAPSRVVSLMREADFARAEVLSRGKLLFARHTAYYRAD
jgi:ubiquinone/menaquinone biosynthesis C-methylase UbiE